MKEKHGRIIQVDGPDEMRQRCKQRIILLDAIASGKENERKSGLKNVIGITGPALVDGSKSRGIGC